MDRIAALAHHHRRRLTLLTGKVLDDGPDAVLDAIVREAQAVSGRPTALLSLALNRTLKFCAGVGLPDDLAVAGGVDLSVSFCQFVVRDEMPVAVDDAAQCAELPQQMVKTRGFKSYLGVPVRIGSEVVGSLCVSGGAVEGIDSALLDRMTLLAERASRRLTEKARTPSTSTPLLARATAPAFGELKNALSPLTSAGTALRVLAADAAPLARVVKAGPRAFAALDDLRDAAAAFDEFAGLADDLDAASARVRDNVDVIDAVLADDDGAGAVDDVVAAAVKLAHHATKIEGGVAVGPVCNVVVDRARVAAGLVAVAVKEVAARGKSAVDVKAVAIDDDVLVGVAGAISDVEGEVIARLLSQLRPDADVSSGGGVVVVGLRRTRCADIDVGAGVTSLR